MGGLSMSFGILLDRFGLNGLPNLVECSDEYLNFLGTRIPDLL